MRALLVACLLATPALAADKPAALQVCVQLPEGEALFSDGPNRDFRRVGGEAWMLDFDFTVNGHDVLRITRSGPSCFRAWLPAERVQRVGFDFSRLSKNLVAQSVPMNVQLKPDLWSDGGEVLITRAPWATADDHTRGELTLKWRGQVVSDRERLPAGAYTLEYVPAPQPKGECPVTLHVRASGTVRPDRNPAFYKELVDWYRREFLPGVVSGNKLRCEPAEALRVTAKLVDGAWRDPLQPAIERVRLPEKEPRYLVSIDGKVQPFTEGLSVELEPGQHLEFSEETLQSASPHGQAPIANGGG